MSGRTGFETVAQICLKMLAITEIRVCRIDPRVAAAGVEEKTDILRWRADSEFRIVAAAGHVVDGLEQDAAI
jgi:hypothetical protein